MRRAARVDANQGTIVAALRAAGCFVQSLAMVGQGCPDLLVGYRGKWFVMEVKDGAKAPSDRRLTQDEKKWHEQAFICARVHVVETVEQALAVVTKQ